MGVGESSTAQQLVEELRARHASINSTIPTVSPQSLLPQEHRKGSGSGAGEHLSGMGARPQKWVRAPMMMGAHPQGWGRAPIRWGRALLEKGLFQKCHNEL